MDLRQRKTRKAIKKAFLKLHEKKPVEKITVKELSGIAHISKATFYLHYRDIYDLAEQLQKEVIEEIYQSIEHPEWVITDPAGFTEELFQAFRAHSGLSRILFSGARDAMIPEYIEQELKKHIFRKYPRLEQDIHFHTLLTFEIYGGFYTYRIQGERFGEKEIRKEIMEISNVLSGAEGLHHFSVQDNSHGCGAEI